MNSSPDIKDEPNLDGIKDINYTPLSSQFSGIKMQPDTMEAMNAVRY